MSYKVLVVAGPTAVGKTKYAIKFAQKFDGEIVSCDSMQLYKYMDIGSAKPTVSERKDAVHHLIDFVDPKDDDFTVAVYQKLAMETIKEIHSRGKLPIISGGTGLYLNSLLYDMDFGASSKNSAYRDGLYEFYKENGAEALHKKLDEADPESAERIHPNNVKRVIRALEAVEIDQKPLKDFSLIDNKNKEIDPVMLGLKRERSNLYERINRRVDELMEMGLLEEVKSLTEIGFSDSNIAMKAIGYKELIAYLDGEYDLQEAVRLIKRNTRRYAKRQMTWFKRYDDMTWFNLDDYEDEDRALEDMTNWVSKNIK